MKTPAQKMKEQRESKRAKGLAPVLVYVPQGKQDEIRQLAKQLTEAQL